MCPSVGSRAPGGEQGRAGSGGTRGKQLPLVGGKTEVQGDKGGRFLATRAGPLMPPGLPKATHTD